MSIIQEALKKAQVDYIAGKVPKVRLSGQANIIISKAIAISKVREDYKVNRALTTWIIFISCIVIIPLIFFRILFVSGITVHSQHDIAGPLMYKDTLPMPRADKARPSSLPAIAIAPVVESAPKPNFTLSGVMQLDNKNQAIINGYILEEGDSISGATVMLIDKDYVLLNLKDKEIKVKLKR